MASPEIMVRELRLTDIPSFVELCMSRDGLDSEAAVLRSRVVEHIAFKNPHADGRPTYIVGIQDGRIVAHLGRMPTRFCVNGSIERGSYFHDLYVHPDIRKKGGQGFFLSMKLYKAAEDASPGFIAMIWTNEINIALQTARKYHQMWTQRLVKHLTFDEKLESVFPAPIATIPKLLTRSALATTDAVRQVLTRKSAKIERLQRFDERFDQLADSTMRTTVTMPHKDSAYLNWKYFDRPGLQSIILAAFDKNEQLLGFSLITEPDAEFRASFLAELTVSDDNPKVIRNLLDASIRTARSSSASRLVAVATHAPYHSALASRLFVPKSTKEPFFLAKTERSPQKNCILSAENWHLSFGDSEGPF